VTGLGPLVVVGDLLLDREVLGDVERLCPEAPVPVLVERSIVDRPGGAGLAALFAASGDDSAGDPAGGEDSARDAGGGDADGAAGATAGEVVLIAAVSRDEAGDRLRELLAEAGIRLVALPLRGPTPEKIRMRAGEHLLMRLDRGDRQSPVGKAPSEAVDAIESARAVLVSDYGRGTAAQPALRAALAERAPHVPVVWDPHPLGGDPVADVRLVTPNRAEAAHFVQVHKQGGTGPAAPGDPMLAAAAAAARLRRCWSAGAVAVTLGERGAVVSAGAGQPVLVPAPLVARGDACGAGDRFASAAASALADGVDVLEAVRAAVSAATAYVATGGALGLLPNGSSAPAPGSPVLSRAASAPAT
jgi:D-beta-D-heptose 7-phosphate kinase / D-beta-D-heptose 1-phosphate adenosyltransferase